MLRNGNRAAHEVRHRLQIQDGARLLGAPIVHTRLLEGSSAFEPWSLASRSARARRADVPGSTRSSQALPNIEGIAARQKCSVRQVNMTISMAFIAPALVKAAVEGRLPRGIGIANLRDAPAEWSLQFERLGLAQP